MPRTQLIAPCALGALALAAFVAGGNPGHARQITPPVVTPPGTGGSDVVALRKEVDDLKAEIERLQEFVEAQAEAGQTLADALTKSEAEGFTAGINPSSREVLLKGLRAQAEAMQSGGAATKGDDKPVDPRRRVPRQRGTRGK